MTDAGNTSRDALLGELDAIIRDLKRMRDELPPPTDEELEDQKFERQLARYLAADEPRRRFLDAMAKVERYENLKDQMRPLLESGDPAQVRRAAHYLAVHLKREEGK
jgi:hypothetical protein